MGRQAVVTAVAVGDRDGDLFAHLRAEGAVAQRAEASPQALKCGRGVRRGPEHVGYEAECPLDLCEGFGAVVGDAVDVDEIDSVHEVLPFVGAAACGLQDTSVTI